MARAFAHDIASAKSWRRAKLAGRQWRRLPPPDVLRSFALPISFFPNVESFTCYEQPSASATSSSCQYFCCFCPWTACGPLSSCSAPQDACGSQEGRCQERARPGHVPGDVRGRQRPCLGCRRCVHLCPSAGTTTKAARNVALVATALSGMVIRLQPLWIRPQPRHLTTAYLPMVVLRLQATLPPGQPRRILRKPRGPLP
jgi:hypothetical protein